MPMPSHIGAQQRLSVLSQHVIAAFPCAAPGQVHVSEEYPEGVHFCCLPDSEAPIHYAQQGPMTKEALPARTFPDLLGLAAKQYPEEIALAVERPAPPPEGPGVAPSLPWSEWKKWTFTQYWQESRQAAKAFIKLGVQHFGGVAIFGFNSPEWMISSIGAMLCGGKYVGIYSTDTAEQLAYKVNHSGSAALFVGGQMEFDAGASKIETMKGLKVIVTSNVKTSGDLKRQNGSVVTVVTWADLLKTGASLADSELESRIGNMKPGHCAGIIYTSGTTGNPKAVMMSHDNIVAASTLLNGQSIGTHNAFKEGKGRLLSYLPLSHIAGAMMDMLNPLVGAALRKQPSTVYFAREYDLKEMTLAERIRFVKPTGFLAVPRVFEKMQAKMMAVGATLTGVKRHLSTWAKGVGKTYARNLQLNGSKARPMLHGLADRLVLSKAREALGLDECGILITGAAPVSVDLLEYFGQLGLMIQNVYGMSETTGLGTICTPDAQRFGTVGPQILGGEVQCFQSGPNGENVVVKRCAVGQQNLTEQEQGELCYRGRHVMMGYMANPDFGEDHVKEIVDKTSATIDKRGWLHSGDKGCIDVDGMTRITGRYKELIIGAGGENIAPVPVEENIKQLAPAVSNVMMVGDQRKYNVALVTLQAEGATGEFPGGDNLMPVVREVNPKLTKISEARNDPKILKYVQAAVDATNENQNVCQSNAWKIQKFVILPRDFSIETGELTATLKLRREVAADIWKKEIDALY